MQSFESGCKHYVYRHVRHRKLFDLILHLTTNSVTNEHALLQER